MKRVLLTLMALALLLNGCHRAEEEETSVSSTPPSTSSSASSSRPSSSAATTSSSSTSSSSRTRTPYMPPTIELPAQLPKDEAGMENLLLQIIMQVEWRHVPKQYEYNIDKEKTSIVIHIYTEDILFTYNYHTGNLDVYDAWKMAKQAWRDVTYPRLEWNEELGIVIVHDIDSEQYLVCDYNTGDWKTAEGYPPHELLPPDTDNETLSPGGRYVVRRFTGYEGGDAFWEYLVRYDLRKEHEAKATSAGGFYQCNYINESLFYVLEGHELRFFDTETFEPSSFSLQMPTQSPKTDSRYFFGFAYDAASAECIVLYADVDEAQFWSGVDMDEPYRMCLAVFDGRGICINDFATEVETKRYEYWVCQIKDSTIVNNTIQFTYFDYHWEERNYSIAYR